MKTEKLPLEQRLSKTDFYGEFADGDRMLQDFLQKLDDNEARASVKGHKLTRRVFVAAAAAALTLALCVTAFAGGLPGFIKNLTAGGMTVNQYEKGMLPSVPEGTDLTANDIFGKTTVGEDVLAPWTDYKLTKLDSLEEAQEIMGFALYVPTFQKYEESLDFIRLGEYGANKVIELWYDNRNSSHSASYTNENSEILTALDWHFVTIAMQYVGDQTVKFDTVGESYTTTVNGYEAVLSGGQGGALQWVRDGILFSVLPDSLYTIDEMMEIAESLVPMQ